MKLLTTTLIALTGVTAVYGQVSAIPKCALKCFEEAVGKTSCSLLDYYCQCSTGAKVIANSAFPCLCTDSDCTAADITQVGKASNEICSSAFAASSKTYTPTPIPSNLCKAATGAASASSTSAPASSSAAPSSSSASSSSSSAPSSAQNAAAPTNVGIQGAMLGMGAVALLAL